MEKKDKETEEKIARNLATLAKGNEKKDFVWRDTLSDGFLPFASYNSKYTEQVKKKVEE